MVVWKARPVALWNGMLLFGKGSATETLRAIGPPPGNWFRAGGKMISSNGGVYKPNEKCVENRTEEL